MAPGESIGGATDQTIEVELVYAAGPHALEQLTLRLPAGATVDDALKLSGWRERFGPALFDALQPGIWGHRCEPGALLRARDRIELYRPLQVDPKEARRQRYRRDGVRRAPR
ncbi:RnfH family protein [Aquincola sp. S2]|uniref:UPF0125 protein HLB44_24055 n=1 Tax=Pseudaquabacterium terrae TaxID=2732868 RepID=A0ABX2EN15_9BURK|nr:RnfH family protein [Aquabacterium terrae]NRF70084.1 RnfH family protein [Aquabacterium terrae]